MVDTTKRLPPQGDTNSCAAYCTGVALAELTGNTTCMTKKYVEDTIWAQIKFVDDGNNHIVSQLAAVNNSDPRRIVTFIEQRQNEINATLTVNESAKEAALTFVHDEETRNELSELFNFIRTGQSVDTPGANARPAEVTSNIFYNASFLMFNKHGPHSSTNYSGLHNILLTHDGSWMYFYNPNEETPVWTLVTNDSWWVLNGQNGGNCTYVFTGVCVEMAKA